MSSASLQKEICFEPYEEVELANGEIWGNQVLLFVQIANSDHEPQLEEFRGERLLNDEPFNPEEDLGDNDKDLGWLFD